MSVIWAVPWINWSSIWYPEEGTCSPSVSLFWQKHCSVNFLCLGREKGLQRVVSVESKYHYSIMSHVWHQFEGFLAGLCSNLSQKLLAVKEDHLSNGLRTTAGACRKPPMNLVSQKHSQNWVQLIRLDKYLDNDLFLSAFLCQDYFFYFVFWGRIRRSWNIV